MIRITCFYIFFFLLSVNAFTQSPKREFRAAWIATVANIDWPSKPGLSSIQQQEEFVRRLDQLKSLGCNAVIVQIRPVCDAFYASSIEPWSYYLTGRQSNKPFPYYDPLTFMVAETHKRNMEFHAWFNPFRALVDSRVNPNPPNHVTRMHPDWVIKYGGKAYLDPGLPEVREYVIKVICDVVKRYDIDAVHLDDYFYPYRSPGRDFPDGRSYNLYGNGMERADWRRSNTNLFISVLNTNIKHIKAYVKLGVSPFGVWRNISKDPNGSATHAGQTTYDDLYADILLWMQNGWVDYVMPQLYWEHGNHAAAFDVLLPWWQAHCYGRAVYYGLGVYRMLNVFSGPWASANEILSQIRDIRQYSNTGFSFYSTSNFDHLRNHLQDSLHYVYNVHPALPPTMKWLDSTLPAPPVLKAIPSSQGTLLQWHIPDQTKKVVHYAVYRFVNNESVNLERGEKLIAVLSGNEYLDADANKYRQCTYIVTALDRLWNESKPSNEATTHL
jgi:uncharacterized lipoprotein YddW (UPF0748 family)